jgi:hypothetical protein
MGGAVAHVELSLTQSFVPHARQSFLSDHVSTLDRWCGAVVSATEPSLVIDGLGLITAISESCCSLLGLGPPATAVGRPLLQGVRLVDFTAAQCDLTELEVVKIPPLLALSSGRLARGLLRVQCRDRACTVDAIATPLRDGDLVVGSLTFFAAV